MKKSVYSLLFLIFCVTTIQTNAQTNFVVEVDTFSLTVPPAIHSGAFSQWNGKWIFIGGRKNGLHGFLPPFAFPTSDANTDVWVVDPNNNQTWTSSIDSLPINYAEALESSNMEYYQQDSMLYIVGGYGWKNSLSDFHTYNTLTAVNIPSLINAVVNNYSIVPFFRQISDSSLQVCGGDLEKIDSVYYLVFGHDFEGTYNVADTLGFFVQHYTKQIRKFQIQDDGVNLSIYNKSAITDSSNFRRRDLNLVPQIFPNGEYGITAFTGVFQQGINLPYFNTIDIKTSGYAIVPAFNQNLSQYHCAVMPMYNATDNNMYSVFFGGMSMYRLDTINNSLVTDSLVPFTKTISMVKRDATGTMTEYKLPIEWPAYLGTNAYFIPDTSIAMYENKIINLDSIHQKTFVGYITGGIESPDSNIAAVASTLSFACSRLYKVYIKLPNDAVNYIKATEPVSLNSYPNPFKGKINFELTATENISTTVSILDEDGYELEILLTKNLNAGRFSFQWNAKHLPSGIYYCLIKTKNYSKVYKLVLTD